MPQDHLLFATHPEVVVDPETPVPNWGLSAIGRARMAAFARSEAVAEVAWIWSSAERKAQEAAAIAGEILDRPVEVDPRLGEIDRSALGFVPEPGFSRLRDRFFAAPDTSPDGWEPAVLAQARIVAAVSEIEATAPPGSLLIVSHGAVGALLLCRRLGAAIDVAFDQPRQGCWFRAPRGDGRPESRWREMPAPDAPAIRPLGAS